MKDLLLTYNATVPRYTSYPPANLFNQSFGTEQYVAALQRSNAIGEQNISVYIHAPYCKQKCHFCGCNSIAWTSDSVIDEYLDAVIAEMKTVFSYLDASRRRISQVHWGGGTPNNLSIAQIELVMNHIASLAPFTDSPEIAIECNPAYLDETYVSELRRIGFTRMSLGIQDFDTKVLRSINRAPSKLPIEELVLMLKNLGFKGVNLDFVYGLPHQTVEGFSRTMESAIKLGVDRIVTFSYAHLPSMMAGQRLIDEASLPSDDQKLDMFLAARRLLTEGGYVAVGFDHYSLPSDELAVASRQKKLRRNFQGYCTAQTTGQVYAFGASGISQLHGAYAQNSKSVDDYVKMVGKTSFAVVRGYALSRDELVCQYVIEELLCNGFLDFGEIAAKWEISVTELENICSFNPLELAPYQADGLVAFDNNTLVISEQGMLLSRNIAQLFDPMRGSRNDGHSKTI